MVDSVDDTHIERPPHRNHVGQFPVLGGRCDVYCRKDRVTLFYFVSGKASAFHMQVPDALDAGKAILLAAETTPFDPDKLVDPILGGELT